MSQREHSYQTRWMWRLGIILPFWPPDWLHWILVFPDRFIRWPPARVEELDGQPRRSAKEIVQITAEELVQIADVIIPDNATPRRSAVAGLDDADMRLVHFTMRLLAGEPYQCASDDRITVARMCAIAEYVGAHVALLEDGRLGSGITRVMFTPRGSANDRDQH
jgi:hypothetical protein